MGSTFYASGSADAFLADRGFDDKWVQKEERKKDGWEEVKTNKKKQLSGAEKRAKAAKISVRAYCYVSRACVFRVVSRAGYFHKIPHMFSDTSVNANRSMY